MARLIGVGFDSRSLAWLTLIRDEQSATCQQDHTDIMVNAIMRSGGIGRMQRYPTTSSRKWESNAHATAWRWAAIPRSSFEAAVHVMFLPPGILVQDPDASIG
jgi:hypothetical protein